MHNVITKGFLLLGLLAVAGRVFAHEVGAEAAPDLPDVEANMASFSMLVTLISFGVIVVLVLIAMLVKNPSEAVKRILFWSIASIVVAVTVALGVATVTLNVNSFTKGPIHWHADFEVWACGQELNLVDPKGFSNKTGSATRHEHNDKRLHYEGVVVREADASLGSFFQVIGGKLTDTELALPTDDGVVSYGPGSTCSGGAEAELQVFVYEVRDDKTFSQRKLTHPEHFVMRSESQVPPGSCIIIEFDTPTEQTDKLCRSYRVAQEIDKLGEQVPPPLMRSEP